MLEGFLLFLLKDALFLLGMLARPGGFPKALSREEEAELIRRMAEGSEEARYSLIEHNLRLVAHIARKYTVPGYDMDDLISIGTIGLIKGVGSYNAGTGTQLSTYAARCIENEILMCLRANAKRRNDLSLQEPIGTDGEGNEITLCDVLGTEPDAIERDVQKRVSLERVRVLVNQCLTERERRVIVGRYGLEDGCCRAQHELAKEMKISRSYISRIEKKAMEKLGEAFEHAR